MDLASRVSQSSLLVLFSFASLLLRSRLSLDVAVCVSLSERYVYGHREHRAHDARVESCLLQLTKR